MGKIIPITANLARREQEEFHRDYNAYRVCERFKQPVYDCCQNCGKDGRFEFAFCSSQCIKAWFAVPFSKRKSLKTPHCKSADCPCGSEEGLDEFIEELMPARASDYWAKLAGEIKLSALDLIASIDELERDGVQSGSDAIGTSLNDLLGFREAWFADTRFAPTGMDEDIPF